MEFNPFERQLRSSPRGRVPARTDADSELTVSASHTESCIRDTYRSPSPVVSESELGAAGGAPADTSRQTLVNTSTSGSDIHHHHHHHHHHYHHYGDFARNQQPRSAPARERSRDRPYESNRASQGDDHLPSYEEAVLGTNTYLRHDRQQSLAESEDRTRQYLPQTARVVEPIAQPPYRENSQAARGNDGGFGRGRRLRSPSGPWHRIPQGAATSPAEHLGFTIDHSSGRRWTTPRASTPEEPRSPERSAMTYTAHEVYEGPDTTSWARFRLGSGVE